MARGDRRLSLADEDETSSPVVPRRRSGPDVPTMVARKPWHTTGAACAGDGSTGSTWAGSTGLRQRPGFEIRIASLGSLRLSR
jgi:hypothetical protein